MSPYLIVFLIILVSAYAEISGEKNNYEILYKICFVIMTLFLCLRYGQGTDYMGYRYAYRNIFATLNISDLLNNSMDVHGETGWKILMSVSKLAGLKFEYFVMILSIFEMFCLDKFIRRFCKYKIFALLLVFPTLYLTYLFSGLRQGLVIAIFMGFMLELFFENKYIKYIILCLICCSFHTVSFILLSVFLTKLKFFDNKNIIICSVVVSWIIGIFLGIVGASFSAFSRDFKAELIPSIAMAERLSLFILVTMCYSSASAHLSDDSIIHISYKIYALGIILYGLFISFGTASRIAVFFKLIEILLLCYCLPYTEKRTRHILIFLIFALQIVMTLKNISSYLNQGNYYSKYNIWNYPYVSIFDKSKIYDVKTVKQAFIID